VCGVKVLAKHMSKYGVSKDDAPLGGTVAKVCRVTQRAAVHPQSAAGAGWGLKITHSTLQHHFSKTHITYVLQPDTDKINYQR